MQPHHQHDLVAIHVLVGEAERTTDGEVALRLTACVVSEGVPVPARGLESVDNAISASSGRSTRVGARSVESVRRINRIVEEEVRVEELDALAHVAGSLVTFDLSHAHCVVQIVNVVQVRGLVAQHQVDRTEGLGLTRSGVVSLTHLGTTIDSKRSNIFVLRVPASDCTCSRATGTGQIVNHVVLICACAELEESVLSSHRGVGGESSITVQSRERTNAVTASGSKLLRNPLMEVSESQLRVVLKDTSEVHLAVCFGQVLAGDVKRVDQARSANLTTMGSLITATSDDLGTRVDMRHSTGTGGHNSEFTLWTFERSAVHIAALQNFVEQRVPLDEQVTVRRHQFIERRRKDIRGNSHD